MELDIQIYTLSILKFDSSMYKNFLPDSKYTFVRNVYVNLIKIMSIKSILCNIYKMTSI